VICAWAKRTGRQDEELAVPDERGSLLHENRTFNNRTQMILQQSGASGLTGMKLQYVYWEGANNGQIAGTAIR
jgi:hypothetical protein